MKENNCKLVFVLIIIPIIISFVSIDYIFLRPKETKCSLNIFIAILSERKNFIKRHTLRQTWIQTIDSINKNNSIIESNDSFCKIQINYKFIIGDKDCLIHELFRKNQYSCHLNEIHFNENNSQIFLHNFTANKGQKGQNIWHKRFHRGFSFVIRHSILVNGLGIHQNFFKGNENLTIVLLNAQNKEIIKTKIISKKSLLLNECYYESIEPLVLNKDFYGLLIIDNELIEIDSNYEFNVTLNQNGFIDVLRAYYGFTDFQSVGYKSDVIIGPTLVYKISDIKAIKMLLKSKNDIQLQRNNELLKVEERLSEERVKNNDILLIESIDVYRNLAEKVLKSIEFAVKSYELSHYLKTDDDCYLNVKNIIKELIPIYNKTKVWFGNFRRVWSLDYWGKWAENDYESPIYPTFACGSGSVLSSDLVQWMSSNVKHLHRFQGEDVSLGIWMSALNPHYIDDKRWLCNNSALNISHTFSTPQLIDEEIIKFHKIIENNNKS